MFQGFVYGAYMHICEKDAAKTAVRHKKLNDSVKVVWLYSRNDLTANFSSECLCRCGKASDRYIGRTRVIQQSTNLS